MAPPSRSPVATLRKATEMGEQQHVVLVGFLGSGKTSVGRALADVKIVNQHMPHMRQEQRKLRRAGRGVPAGEGDLSPFRL